MTLVLGMADQECGVQDEWTHVVVGLMSTQSVQQIPVLLCII